MSVEQQYSVTVVVNGATIGAFDTYTGGDAIAKSNKHRPGGMGEEKSFVALPSYTDMTVSRVLERQRDWELTRQLVPLAGRVLGSVTIQPLDENGAAWGASRVASGRFLGVKGWKADSNSDAVLMYELDFSIEHWA